MSKVKETVFQSYKDFIEEHQKCYEKIYGVPFKGEAKKEYDEKRTQKCVKTAN